MLRMCVPCYIVGSYWRTACQLLLSVASAPLQFELLGWLPLRCPSFSTLIKHICILHQHRNNEYACTGIRILLSYGYVRRSHSCNIYNCCIYCCTSVDPTLVITCCSSSRRLSIRKALAAAVVPAWPCCSRTVLLRTVIHCTPSLLRPGCLLRLADAVVNHFVWTLLFHTSGR